MKHQYGDNPTPVEQRFEKPGFEINPNPKAPIWYSYREAQILHPWVADNQYLTTGYMPPTDSFVKAATMLLSLSNQWANFWSHFLGLFIGLAYMIYGWYTQMAFATWEAQTAYIAFCFGGLYCMTASSCFHGFGHMKWSIFHFTLTCDFTGIAILISTSYLPMLWNMLACWADMRTWYLGILVFMTSAQIIAPFMVSIISDKNIVLRVILYSSVAVFGFVPSFHVLMLVGYEQIGHVCDGLFTMYGLYGVGVLLYVMRWPEKLSPGTFDYIGHSHSLFHVCIALAVYQHTWNVLQAHAWGLDHDDPWECHDLKSIPMKTFSEAACGIPWISPLCFSS